MGQNQKNTYWNANYTTYLLLQDQSSFGSLAEKIPPFMEKESEEVGANINFTLEPFDRVHLHSPYSDFVPNTSIEYLYMLAGVAFLILVIVCFTYINLSTAKSVERAKEVGIRKVSGAQPSQLFWQFIGESCLTIRFWDQGSGELIQTRSVHRYSIAAMDVNKDHTQLVSVDLDGKAVFTDLMN